MNEEQKRTDFLCRSILDNELEPNDLSVEDLKQVHARLTEMDVQAWERLEQAEQELLHRDKLTAEEEDLLRKIHLFLMR